MSRRLTQAAIVLAILALAAQLIRPAHTTLQTDPGRSIRAHAGAQSDLVAVLDRSCGECHSNSTAQAWYWQIAPLSWVMAQSVAEGRKVVNFSEWGGYSTEQQRDLLATSCQDATTGRMPGLYTLVNRNARLSSADIETICAAAGRLDAHAATTPGQEVGRER